MAAFPLSPGVAENRAYFSEVSRGWGPGAPAGSVAWPAASAGARTPGPAGPPCPAGPALRHPGAFPPPSQLPVALSDPASLFRFSDAVVALGPPRSPGSKPPLWSPVSSLRQGPFALGHAASTGPRDWDVGPVGAALRPPQQVALLPPAQPRVHRGPELLPPHRLPPAQCSLPPSPCCCHSPRSPSRRPSRVPSSGSEGPWGERALGCQAPRG